MSHSLAVPASSLLQLAPHQSSAVGRILDILACRPGILLADDVGLGKSWIAAAVAREFTQDGQGVEVIVPRALEPQWRRLLNSFDVPAELMTHDSLRGKFSFPGGPGPGLLIVDEAHRFRNPATGRYRALALRSVARRLLLVTATPICNQLDDLRALIHLMAADDALACRGVFSMDRAFEENRAEELAIIRDELVIRRTKVSLPHYLRFGSLRRGMIRFPLPRNEDEIRSQLQDLRFPLIASDSHHAILRAFLWRRLESGVAAFRDSVARQLRYYRRALESARQGRLLTKVDYRRIFGADSDGLVFQELLFREFWTPPTAGVAGLVDSIDREMSALDRLDSLTRDLPDAKAHLLLGILRDNRSEPILIFTAALATARDLFRRVSESERSALLSSRARWLGTTRNLTFEQVLSAFDRGEARVLILTDLGAEGLNLQEASLVVHYDLPWNPVRLEQRDGRIHRIGQARDQVRALYFVPERRSDQMVLRRLAVKNRMRRRIWIEPSHCREILTPEQGWARKLLRGHLTAQKPQVKMLRRLDQSRSITVSLGDLLSHPYRAGAELVIGQMASEFLDPVRLSYLETLLGEERRMEKQNAGWEKDGIENGELRIEN